MKRLALTLLAALVSALALAQDGTSVWPLAMLEGYAPCQLRDGVCYVFEGHTSVVFGAGDRFTTPAVFDVPFRCAEVEWTEPVPGSWAGHRQPFVAPAGATCYVKSVSARQ